MKQLTPKPEKFTTIIGCRLYQEDLFWIKEIANNHNCDINIEDDHYEYSSLDDFLENNMYPISKLNISIVGKNKSESGYFYESEFRFDGRSIQTKRSENNCGSRHAMNEIIEFIGNKGFPAAKFLDPMPWFCFTMLSAGSSVGAFIGMQNSSGSVVFLSTFIGFPLFISVLSQWHSKYYCRIYPLKKRDDLSFLSRNSDKIILSGISACIGTAVGWILKTLTG